MELLNSIGVSLLIVSMNVLIIICLVTVLVITTMTLIAIKWGYSVQHTIDPILEETADEQVPK